MNIEVLKAAIKILESADSRVSDADSRPVIVRSRDAGVLFGRYAGNDGSTVHLTNAVQMWRWEAAKGGTLLDCATYGVEPTGCKFSEAQAKVTVFGACALIDVTPEADTILSAIKGGDWS